MPDNPRSRRLLWILLASVAVHALLLMLPTAPAPNATLADSVRIALQHTLPAAAATESSPGAESEPTAKTETSAAPPPAARSGDAAAVQPSNVPTNATPENSVTTATPPADATTQAANPQPNMADDDLLTLVCPQRAQPAYPPLSRRLGESGQVDVRLRVSADGRVSEAWVVGRSGYPRLDRAALAAVMAWNCHPPMRDGVAVDLVTTTQVEFRIE